MNTLTYVRSNRDLRRIKKQLQQAYIALDTEFVRKDTYYPQLSLVQLAAGAAVFLIDIPTISDFSPLTELLVNPNIEKIVHSPRQDSEILQIVCGNSPTPIFDTQLATTFLGSEIQVSYKRLVWEKIGVKLDKAQTYSDWMRRPLTEKQIRYAAEDVIYLERLRTILADELQAQNKSKWFEEESRNAEKISYDFCEQFLNKAKHKPAIQYAVLKCLVKWREKQAQAKNLPRQWIITDQCIRKIARLCQAPHKMKRRHLVTLVQQIQDCKRSAGYTETLARVLQSIDCNIIDKPVPRPQLDEVMKENLAALQSMTRQAAHKYGIAPALIANKDQLMTIVRSQGIENPFTDWRAKIMRKYIVQVYPTYDYE